MRLPVVSALLAIGCGTSAANPPPTPAQQDSGTKDAASDVAVDLGPPSSTTCGPEPWITVSGTIVVSKAGSIVPPIKPRLSAPGFCTNWTPSLVDGVLSGKITRGFVGYMRIESEGAIPALTADYRLDANYAFGGALQTYSTDFSFLVPELAKGMWLIAARPTSLTGACTDNAGLFFKVFDGDTEVPVTMRYFDPAAKSFGPGPTAKEAPTVASDLPLGKALKIRGSKVGCTTIQGGDVDTGTYHVEPGFMTIVELNLVPS